LICPDNNLLLLTSEPSGEIDLSRIGRSGTVWVYAVNSEDIYSSPTKYGYNLPKPTAPTVSIKTFIQSFRVTYGSIPKSCTAVIRIDNQDYKTKDTLFVYNESAGLFNVSVAFEDYFGLGEFSPQQMVEIKATIPKELIDKEALGLQGMENRIQQLDADVESIAGAWTQKVQDLENNIQSRITQLENGIDLRVEEKVGKLDGNTILSRINLSSGGVRIDGKLLHVTGQSQFDDNIITNKMLQANAVTADKIKTDTLAALSANLGDVRSGTITSTTIKNESGTFSVDPNGNIRGANIVASTISADSIFNAGFKVKNIDYAVLTVAHGQDCPPIGNYSVNECIFVPIGYKMTEHGSKAKRQRRGNDTWNRIASKITNENCTIYLHSQDPWGVKNGDNHRAESKVGLNGRKAICQEWWTQREPNGNDGYEYYEYLNLGVLYVLVIGKKG